MVKKGTKGVQKLGQLTHTVTMSQSNHSQHMFQCQGHKP